MLLCACRWYPPGHGDLYESLAGSGILQKLLSEGREILFVSNVDNLGATVDLQILNFLSNGLSDVPAPEFLMELTEKTRADVKGGTLIEYENRLRLLEMAQVPKEHVDEFASVRKFRQVLSRSFSLKHSLRVHLYFIVLEITALQCTCTRIYFFVPLQQGHVYFLLLICVCRIFNTNNLWTNLRAVERVMAAGTLTMEVIVNPKVSSNTVNIRGFTFYQRHNSEFSWQ